jgi:lipoprotein signal peptidase
MHPLLVGAFYALPFVYAIADYAENILTTNVFSDGVAWSFAAGLLPWASSLKFATFAISLIVIIRFAIFRLMPPGDLGAR